MLPSSRTRAFLPLSPPQYPRCIPSVKHIAQTMYVGSCLRLRYPGAFPLVRQRSLARHTVEAKSCRSCLFHTILTDTRARSSKTRTRRVYCTLPARDSRRAQRRLWYLDGGCLVPPQTRRAVGSALTSGKTSEYIQYHPTSSEKQPNVRVKQLLKKFHLYRISQCVFAWLRCVCGGA